MRAFTTGPGAPASRPQPQRLAASSSTTPTPCCARRRTQAGVCMALDMDLAASASSLPIEATDSLPSTLLGAAALVPLFGFGIYRLYVYSQLEYITAAMLSRHVPRDGPGATVIQVGGGTKELYYYPKNCLAVTVVGKDVNKSLMEQAGLQAGVPTQAKVQAPSSLAFAASGSLDAVVSIGTAQREGAVVAAGLVAEAARVLKPGRPLIFIEKDERSLLNLLRARQDEWEQVEYDSALAGPDAHVVGVAIRSTKLTREAAMAGEVGPTKRQVMSNRGKEAKGFT